MSDSTKSINDFDGQFSFPVMKVLGEGWKIFKDNAGPLIGFLFLAFFIFLIVYAVIAFLFMGGLMATTGMSSGNYSSANDAYGLFAQFGIIALLMIVVVGAVSSCLYGGFYAYLANTRLDQAEFSDFFEGFGQAGRVLSFSFIYGTLYFVISIGMSFLIASIGVYDGGVHQLLNLLGSVFQMFIAIPFIMGFPLLFNVPEMGVTDVIKNSVKIGLKNFWAFLGFSILLNIALFMGALLCGLGLIVAFPWYVACHQAVMNRILPMTSSELEQGVDDFGTTLRDSDFEETV